MSMTIAHTHRLSNRVKLGLGFVIASVALFAIVAIATTAAVDDTNVARSVPQAAATSKPAAVAPTEGSDVPDAATAFRGRDMPEEEPAPTF